MMNQSKCHMKLFPARIKGMLAWYCDVNGHDHGPHHSIIRNLTADSIMVDPDELYDEMTKTPLGE